MTSHRRTAADAARAIADALAASGQPYAIGGALALGVAGVPRGTKDVDVNVFVEADLAGVIIDVLTPLGIVFDRGPSMAKAARDGMMIGDWEGMRIDVFFVSIPFSEEAGRTRSQVTVDGWTGSFLSPESIAVFKLLFFRIKDLADLAQLIAVRERDLDHAYIRGWLVTMMGEDDERVKRWDELVARYGPS